MGNDRSPLKASIVFGETGKSELEIVTRPRFVIRGIVNPYALMVSALWFGLINLGWSI